MVTPLSSIRQLSYLIGVLLLFDGSYSLLLAEDASQAISSPKTRTVVADILDIEGDFHIVRGERGEIRIEVTPDTKVSEEFKFGDRIKAILLPNDVAQSITRAGTNETTGVTVNEPAAPPPAPPIPTETKKTTANDSAPILTPTHKIPKVRTIVANILMVDGSFYIVRSEFGEIQIEITPETELSEEFKFGDKIKARVTSSDKALTVTRASKDEPMGIQVEAAPPTSPSSSTSTSPVPSSPTKSPSTPDTPKQKKPEPIVESAPAIRIIVADVLMLDGDLYIVRGERGEIRIEVTPKTAISESFDYGDRIKAKVLPDDKAVSIERAGPNDPTGITTP